MTKIDTISLLKTQVHKAFTLEVMNISLHFGITPTFCISIRFYALMTPNKLYMKSL
jgi:hypothetical protein